MCIVKGFSVDNNYLTLREYFFLLVVEILLIPIEF